MAPVILASPGESHENAKMINHSKLEVIPDAHHALNITHANEVNRIINDWLTETTYSNHSQHI